MESILSILLIGCAILALYDSIGSILSRILGFEYVWWAFGSFIIYGVFCIYSEEQHGFIIAFLSTFLLGVFDGSAGMYIAYLCNATINEKDKRYLKITPFFLIEMGIIAVIMGVFALILYK